MAEAVEIQLARLQEQLKALTMTLAEDREARKESDKQLGAIAITVSSLDTRLEAVEKQLAHNAPTIEEFITIKHQVQGAGKLGKAVWLVGGVLIGALFQAREAIRSLFVSVN